MHLINEKISIMVQSVIDGATDPLEVYALLKEIDKTVKNAISEIEEDALSEAEKYGKSFEHLGLNWEVRQGRRNYDFKHISLWNEHKEKLKRIEDISKACASNNNVSIDPDTGEEIEPAKITFSKSSLIVKL